MYLTYIHDNNDVMESIYKMTAMIKSVNAAALHGGGSVETGGALSISLAGSGGGAHSSVVPEPESTQHIALLVYSSRDVKHQHEQCCVI